MTQTTLWDETTHAGKTLFHNPISRMVRRTDPPTSHAAAEKVSRHLSFLEQSILNEYHRRGPMTAKECERLDVFSDLAPSTVRCRISHLAAIDPPFLKKTGVVRDGCAEYEYCKTII